jgi:hypothetical protein
VKKSLFIQSQKLLVVTIFLVAAFSRCTKKGLPEPSFDINSDVFLPTQRSVDSFVNVYRRYNAITINGSVVIGGSSPNSDVNNISKLIKIKSIKGNLGIWGTLLNSLTGLEKIKTLNNVYIELNHSLVDFTGLGSLETIGGFLYIESNEKLINLSGLENLERIKGSLKFTNGFFGGSQSYNPLLSSINLPALKSIGGDLDLNNIKTVTAFKLQKLDSISGSLRISHADKLTDFSGFGSLKYIGGELSVTENQVNSFNGFNNLVFIGESLNIGSNPNIHNLNGLGSLYEVGTYIQIAGNINLTSLDGLNALRIATQINVEYNRNLVNFCAIKELIKNLLILFPSASPYQLIVLNTNSDTLPYPYFHTNVLNDCP